MYVVKLFLSLVLMFSAMAGHASAAATLNYFTFLGGLNNDKVTAVTVDTAGNIYVVGTTGSADFATSFTPCTGLFDDIFVAKFDPTFNMLYSTCIGGIGVDVPTGLTVDINENVYVTGNTTSIDFPVIGAAQSVQGGGRDGFVFKLSIDGGTIEYSTFLGGSGDDSLNGIAVSPAGDIYVAGTTTSYDLSVSMFTVDPKSEFAAYVEYCTMQILVEGDITSTVNCGNVDAFVAGLTWNGALSFMHYMGGKGYDAANGIALDSGSGPVVVGTTSSSSLFPKVGAAFNDTISGSYDAFITQYDYSGAWTASTYFGGTGSESANAVAIGSDGNIYITGSTDSSDLPTLMAYKSTVAGKSDAFVAKLYPGLSALAYSTYVGGAETDTAYGISVDTWGYVSIAGTTRSIDYPVTETGTHYGGWGDAFLTQISPNGSEISNSFFIGGIGEDSGAQVAFSKSSVYVAGSTGTETPFTATPTYQVAYGGGWSDGFLSEYLIDHTRDTALPIITATVPVADTLDAPIDTYISLTFTEPLDAASVTTDAFTVKETSAIFGSVSGTVKYDPLTYTVVFYPSSDLNENSEYSATVSRIKDTAGNVMTASSWLFTTVGISLNDTTAPTIVSKSPLTSATEVAVDSTVDVTFSEDVATGTLTTANITVAPTTDLTALVPGAVKYDAATFTASFIPDNALEYSTEYTATVTGVKDIAGNVITDVTWVFNTGAIADTTAPTVTGMSPADLSTDVATTSYMAAYFSETMDSTSFTSSTVIVDRPGELLSVVEATIQYDSINNAIVITPTAELLTYTTYQVTLDGVKDVAGNLLEKTVWSFTTGSVPDITIPTIANISPVGASTSVAVNLIVSVIFTEDMDPTTITTQSFLVDGVVGDVAYDSATWTATFTPSTNMAYSTTYIVKLTSEITDLAGNALEEYATNFTTEGIPDPTTSGNIGCFVATAAYGSYLDPHVKTLRDFRDKHLITNMPGRAFVRFYYSVSPPIANFIKQHEVLRVVTRWALTPLIMTIEHPVTALVSLSLLLAIMALVRLTPVMGRYAMPAAILLITLLLAAPLHAEDYYDDEEEDEETAATITDISVKYGNLNYREKTSYYGSEREAKVTLPLAMVEIKKRYEGESLIYWGWKLAAGGTAQGNEQWTSNGVATQINTMAITGPLGIGMFHPSVNIGLGITSEDGKAKGRSYLSGGYDIQLMRKGDFYDTQTGITTKNPYYEIAQLPKLGLGVDVEYFAEEFGFYLGAEYSRIVGGRITYSYVNSPFNTQGDIFSANAGFAYRGEGYTLKIGAQYIGQALDESSEQDTDTGKVVFPATTSNTLLWVIGLSY